MKIINFIKAAEKIEPLVWNCDCGNCSFILHINGDVECAKCNGFHTAIIEHYQVVRKWIRKGNKDEK